MSVQQHRNAGSSHRTGQGSFRALNTGTAVTALSRLHAAQQPASSIIELQGLPCFDFGHLLETAVEYGRYAAKLAEYLFPALLGICVIRARRDRCGRGTCSIRSNAQSLPLPTERIARKRNLKIYAPCIDVLCKVF